MKKILFLTDFSEVAENAFIYALSLAEKITAEVHILHIAHIIEAKDEEEQFRIHPLAKMVQEQQEANDKSEYNAEIKRLEKVAWNNRKMNVPVEFHFEKGGFLEIIKDYIDKHQISVVVMGTSGANTIDKKLFGSNTANLINEIDIPLLAVPAKAKFTAIGSFTAAVLLSEKEYNIIKRLTDNSILYGYEFNCVHIAVSHEEASIAKKNIDKWLSNIGDANIPVNIVVNTNVEEGLKEFVEDNKTDILCIIHRNYSFFQRLFKINHSKRLLRQSKTALLIYNNNY